jgi:hypothetical protein
MFVVTIFVATVLTFTTFFIRQRIGPGKKVVMLEPRTVDDKFAIVIEKEPEMTDEELANIKSVLEATGAEEINEKEEPEGYFKEEHD